MAGLFTKTNPKEPLTPAEGIHSQIEKRDEVSGWIIDSQYIDTTSGIAPWYENNEKLNFDKADIRFKSCLKVAQSLKQRYPNHDALSEAAITKRLVAEIHKQYGNYDEKDGGAYLYGAGRLLWQFTICW